MTVYSLKKAEQVVEKSKFFYALNTKKKREREIYNKFAGS